MFLLNTEEKKKGISWSPYQYDGECDAEEPSDTVAELDTIDVANTANRLKLLAAARVLAFPAFVLACSILTIPGVFESEVLLEPMQKYGAGMPTPSTTLGIMMKLCTWGLFEDVTLKHVALAMFGIIFTVPKCTKTLRLIFDCRTQNTSCRRPPPVCLPSIVEVLEMARNCRCIILGDLRHYFHQIGLPENMKKYFAVRCGGRFFRGNTLPMGHSWSPHLAQSISLLLLVHCEEKQLKLFDYTFLNGEKLPTYIPILWKGERAGFACLAYDNFGLFLDIDNPQLNAAIASRLVNNARHFGIIWKELHKFRRCNPPGGLIHTEDSDILKPPTKRSRVENEKSNPPQKRKLPIFLGVELNMDRDTLRWRHAPKRADKLEKLQLKPSTRRQIAEIVGSVIWDCMIQLKCLGEVADIIEYLSTMAKETSHKKDWDSPPTVMPPQQWLELVAEWHTTAKANDWICNRPIRAAAEYAFACSDAADEAAGGVEICLTTGAVKDFWYDDKSKVLEEHIFINEVVAAVKTVKWLARRHVTRPIHFTILVDNIPARRALERGYSTNRAIARVSWRMWKWADAEGVDIHFVDVASKLNAADCLTRDWQTHKDGKSHNYHGRGSFCSDRVLASKEILAGLRAGRPTVSDARGVTWTRIVALDIPDQLELVDEDDIDKYLDLEALDVDAEVGDAAF